MAQSNEKILNISKKKFHLKQIINKTRAMNPVGASANFDVWQ